MVCVHFFIAHASELTESALILNIHETAAYKNQQSGSEGVYSNSEVVRAKYQPQLQGNVGYAASKEDPLFQFAPIINPARNASVGIAQKLPMGVNAKIEAFSDQVNIPAFNVNRASRTGARLDVEVDLLSNFLGRRDWSELKNARIKKQVANIQSELNAHTLIQDLRKSYWSYMGLEESYKIAEALLSSAKKFNQEILSRKKVGAADQSDVARAQAQLASRQTQMSMIQYQKEQIYQQFKIQYPDVTTIPYQSTQTVLKEVQDCIVKIKAEDKFRDTTDFTKIITLLEEEKRLSVKQANTISDWDVKLKGQYQKNAVGEGFSDSRELFNSQPKEAYQVGLQVSVPLGSSLSKAEKHSINQTLYAYDSQIGVLRQTINTQHQKALSSLAFLEAAVSSQGLSVDNLRASAESARKKYTQARISQIEYILEQDKLFSTEVDSIQNRLQIINETLDYIKTFNQQKCLFNKGRGV